MHDDPLRMTEKVQDFFIMIKSNRNILENLVIRVRTRFDSLFSPL